MPRQSLDEIMASDARVDRRAIDATTEADIRRQMIEDGEDPDAPVGEFEEELPPAEVRKGLGLTQERFAQLIGIPVATLRNWEQNRVRMDPAARMLMRLVHAYPESVLRRERRQEHIAAAMLALVAEIERQPPRADSETMETLRRLGDRIADLVGAEQT